MHSLFYHSNSNLLLYHKLHLLIDLEVLIIEFRIGISKLIENQINSLYF